jgi:hypothetical protein
LSNQAKIGYWKNQHKIVLDKKGLKIKDEMNPKTYLRFLGLELRTKMKGRRRTNSKTKPGLISISISIDIYRP